MKRTILISIIASTVVFGAAVDNFTTDIVNKAQGGSITSADVDQGKTLIKGSADVDDLTITQRGDTADSTGNLLDSVTITGGVDGDGLKVNQGTTIVDNARVNGVTIDSDSAINGGTINAVGEVSQGKTEVSSGGTLENVKIESTNTINSANISGNVNVSQASVLVNSDANASDSTADNTDIKSTNTIDEGVAIADSTVKQSSVEINGNGTDVSGLGINQTNTLQGEGEIQNSSKTLQGIVKVDTGAKVNGLTTNVQNTMNNLSTDNSTAVQNHINIHSGSQVTNMSVDTIDDNHNTMSGVSLTNSQATQNTYNITNNSEVTNLSGKHNNIIQNSTMSNLTLNQDLVDINSSTVSGAIINSTNNINKVITDGANNKINQAITVINNSTVTTPSITSDNTIDNVKLNGSEVIQNYVSISAGADVSGLALNNTNSVTDTDGVGNDINSSMIVQAGVVLANSTISALRQDTTNSVTDSQVVNSALGQAIVGIGDSTIGGTGIDIDATNSVSANISDSTVSQNGLYICNSTVNDLNIDQTNSLTSDVSNGSTVSQGDITIGNMEDCDIEVAEPQTKEF